MCRVSMAICSLFLLLASAVYAAGAWIARRSPDYRDQAQDDQDPLDSDLEHVENAEDPIASDAPLLEGHDRLGRSSDSL